MPTPVRPRSIAIAVAIAIVIAPAAARADDPSPPPGYIGFADPDGSTIERMEPWLGPQRTPLSGAAFYRALERPDLEARFRQRAAVRLGLGISGAALAVAGAVLMIATPVQAECVDPTVTPCAVFRQAPDTIPRLATGGALAGVGIVMALVATILPGHPLSADAAYKAVGEHNQKVLRVEVVPVIDPATAVLGLFATGRF